ncbi:MAG: putative sugar O-methyltransferase [Pseudomonadota bacterium]
MPKPVTTAEKIKDRIQRGLAKVGYQLRKLEAPVFYDEARPLPADATSTLKGDNPELLALRQRYAATGLPVVTPSTWWNQERLSTYLHFAYFRGDNAYVYAYREQGDLVSRARFLLYTRYIQARDPRGLLSSLKEDGAFGCWTYDYEGLPTVSRDLLDSINEIYFLDRHFKIFDKPNLRILDIGAGYGRMADRMLNALPNISTYYCTDAIPDSTFICGYNLKYRQLTDRAKLLPLDEFQSTLQPGQLDLAMNIHSFSECTLEAITWWLQQLVRLKVPYFMLVPNEPDELLSREADDSRKSFRPLLEQLGFEQVATELIYQDKAMAEFMLTNDRMMLFKIKSAA